MRNFWVLFAKSEEEVDESREFMSVYLKAHAARREKGPRTHPHDAHKEREQKKKSFRRRELERVRES